MIKLKDILNEAKQIGNLYHFTFFQEGNTLFKILKSGVLKPSSARMEKNGYISFTRNKSLGNLQFYKPVRITIDGDKLSNKYKIQPYSQLKPETDYDKEYGSDIGYSKANNNSEFEEIINSNKYGGSIEIIPYIKQIDIKKKNFSNANKQYKDKILKICQEKNISINFIDKF